MASTFPFIALVLPPKPNPRFRPRAPHRPIGPTSPLSNPRTGLSGLNRSRWSWFFRAASPGPPPAQPEPPSGEDPIKGVQVVVSNIRDRVRIFFAVFFWMFLFFWASAWDGRDGSRKNKGPWFKK